MQADDIHKAPKLFAEDIKIGLNSECFVLAVSSGSQAQFYTITPAHAKRLSQYLEYEVSQYENEHGKINAKWSPSIVSPVQKVNRPTDGS